MNVKNLASSASWLIFGVAALSGVALAAEPATPESVASKPAMHDMSVHEGEHTEGMKCNHQDSMMKAHDGGMMCGQDGKMCDHKAGMSGEHGAGMMCNHEAGMACDHKGGMMSDHKAGMPCAHKAGMMSDHEAGMPCDHKGGMMVGRMAGMMGGYGAGMMGLSRMPLIMSLDLSDDQRSRISKLSGELQGRNLATKGSIMQEAAKLRDLYAADKRNPAAIGKVYQKMFDMQRKMIEATITAQNRIEEVLTPAQRTQLKDMRKEATHSTTDAHDHAAH